VEICHGTPFDEDVYVFDDLDALRAIRAARRPLCLFGHTHVPGVFLDDPYFESPADLPDDTDIIEDINLDSIELLNFMLELEGRLAIRIDFDRMEFSTLNSIAGLAAFLAEVRSYVGSAAEN